MAVTSIPLNTRPEKNNNTLVYVLVSGKGDNGDSAGTKVGRIATSRDDGSETTTRVETRAAGDDREVNTTQQARAGRHGKVRKWELQRVERSGRQEEGGSLDGRNDDRERCTNVTGRPVRRLSPLGCKCEVTRAILPAMVAEQLGLEN